MNLKNHAQLKDAACIGLIMLLSLWVSWPLFINAIPDTHDTINAILRHLSMRDFFGQGQFIPRWVGDYAFGYGYPVFNFYPPMFYLISGALSAVFQGAPLAINMASVVVTLFSGLSMYLLARELWGRAGGLLSAGAYLLLPYRLVDLYVRGAYAEFTSFIFLPLIFWGILSFSRSKSPLALLTLTLSTAGLFLTHNVITMIFFPIAFLYAVILSTSSTENIKKTGLPLATSFFIGISLAAFFWIPALIEKSAVRMGQLGLGYYSYTHHFVAFSQLWKPSWGYGISAPGINDGMSFQIGIVHIILVLISTGLLILRKKDNTRLQVLIFAGLFLATIFMTLEYSDFIWSRIKLLQLCQFPWRFLTIAGFAASVLAGGVVFFFKGRGQWLLALAALIAITAVNIPYAKAQRMDPFLQASPSHALRFIRPGDNMEFLPLTVKLPLTSPAPNLFYLMQGNGTTEQFFSKTPVNHSLVIKAKTPVIACFTNYNFPGWRVLVDGKIVPLLDNRFGLIMFAVAPGEHHVRIDFTATPVHKWATAVSILALWTLALTAFFTFRRLPIA